MWRHDDKAFWSKVQGDDVGACWLWTGWRNHAGYGQYSGMPASRVAYQMMRGEIPHGLYVDHLCSNPPCVNPWHLEVVSPRMNTTRAIDRGRQANRPRMVPGNLPRYHPVPRFAKVAEWARGLLQDGELAEITLDFLKRNGHLRGQQAVAAMSWLAHWDVVDPTWKKWDPPRPQDGIVQIVPDRALPGGVWVAERT